MGLKDEMGADTVKIFCPKCQCVYHPPPIRSRSSSHHGAGAAGVDGAAFGTTFPHLFLMTFSNLVPDPLPPNSAYVPRVFGFRVHMSARQRTPKSSDGADNASGKSSTKASRLGYSRKSSSQSGKNARDKEKAKAVAVSASASAVAASAAAASVAAVVSAANAAAPAPAPVQGAGNEKEGNPATNAASDLPKDPAKGPTSGDESGSKNAAASSAASASLVAAVAAGSKRATADGVNCSNNSGSMKPEGNRFLIDNPAKRRKRNDTASG